MLIKLKGGEVNHLKYDIMCKQWQFLNQDCKFILAQKGD